MHDACRAVIVRARLTKTFDSVAVSSWFPLRCVPRRRLFAELEAGPRRSADPTSFAAGLQIDHTIQQDGQEFMKLLLDLLQRRYADADSRVRPALAVAVLQSSGLLPDNSAWGVQELVFSGLNLSDD